MVALDAQVGYLNPDQEVKSLQRVIEVPLLQASRGAAIQRAIAICHGLHMTGQWQHSLVLMMQSTPRFS
jgi:hypothetical protein